MKQKIGEALAVATQAVNDWLAAHHPLLSLQLEDGASVKATVSRFLDGAKGRTVYWWNWERLYFKRVRGRNAWLFSLRRGEQPVALCLGTISIGADHVALDYVERRSDAPSARGASAAAGFQFALAVATVLELDQVRINKPLNEKLAQFYARTFNMTPVRQTPGGDVNYLYWNVKL